MTIPASPVTIRSIASCRAALPIEPVRSTTLVASAAPPSIPPCARSPSIAEIERWCCWASTSVGARSAACPPLSTTWSIARSATRVLPEPTSPWSSRFIGWSRASSSATRSPISRWPAVSSKGRRASKAARIPSGRPASGARALLAVGRTPPGEHQLEDQRLLEAEALLGRAELAPLVGGVDPAQRLHDVEQLELLAQLGGEDVGHVGDQVEGRRDDLLEVPRVELGGQRVDRASACSSSRASAPSRANPWGCSSCQLPRNCLALPVKTARLPGPELGLVLVGQALVGAEQGDGEVGAVGPQPDRRTELAAVAG